MSTRSYTDYEAVRERIAAVRARWRGVLLARGLLAVGVVALAAVLLIALAEGLIHLPVAGRVVLLVTSAACLAAAFVWHLVRPSLRRLSDEEVARHIERACPEMRNGLINAVQLSRDERAPSAELIDRAITETVLDSSRVDFGRAISLTLVRRLAIAAAGLVLVLVFYNALFPGRLTNALARVFRPTDESIPVVGSVLIERMEPATSPVTVVFGQPLAVTVWFSARDPKEVVARMIWEYAGGERHSELMTPDGDDAFTFTIDEVKLPLVYAVQLDDSTSQRFEVEVLQEPFVESIGLEYNYPDYTGLADLGPVPSPSGDIEAPAGTRVTVHARVSRPVKGGELRIKDGPASNLELVGGEILSAVKRSRDVRGGVYVHNTRAEESYHFYFVDPSGRESTEVGRRVIRAIADRVPTVAMLSPARNVTAHPGETVPLSVEANDDYGLAQVTLVLKRNDESPMVLRVWDRFANAKSEAMTFALELAKDAYRAGEVLSVYAVARDNCDYYDPSAPRDAPRWHETTSAVRLITLRDREEASKEVAEDLRGWRERLEAILRRQQTARASTSTFAPAMDRATFVNRSTSVSTDQLSLFRDTTVLAEDMTKLEGKAASLVARTLSILSRNEMVKAQSLASNLAKLDVLAEVTRPRDELLAVQDRIIATLKQVLDLLPQVERENLKEEDAAAGTDMPQDGRKAWKEAAEKLKEFIDQQKKILADSQDLAKKPVDDFTAEDEDKLKELAAVEDEWSKFMKELHKDLSKLPNQDFSNPSLLKELLEIQSDVEKAADALTRKEIEIAVPLEQAGVENAEEMTTHIEKWLPDSADRDQWKMEEPTEDLETPMAELPKELEDIVGDLMEDEEDLYEEMEDASSAWTDSIDKGAGWDAMDGPISNMSAQGVTGNRLPNSSEIGGRSGEGRTGKSGGEMVEEEATGKGGRRTPTRLTPDPYESGEVKDSSKEPAGGSTGGGKVSGGAAEGLEGPVPPPLARKMERLAGKQADLRNRAERVKVAFKVLNYDSTGLDKVIDTMKGAEDDLKNYRYRNFLRKREVLLRGLDSTGLILRSRTTVARDFSATLPSVVQQEIMDTAEQELPAEYRDLVRKYYESLSRE